MCNERVTAGRRGGFVLHVIRVYRCVPELFDRRNENAQRFFFFLQFLIPDGNNVILQEKISRIRGMELLYLNSRFRENHM